MTTGDRAPRVNCCYAVPLRGGWWGACQVLSVGDQGADVAAFDWRGKRPPTLKDLAKAKPLVLTHHAHNGAPARHYVSGPVPPGMVLVGERAPLVRSAMKPPSYADWDVFELQVRLQQRWDHDVPKAEIKRYRAGDKEITLGGTTALNLYNPTFGATSDADFPWPASDALPWQALDVAGTLTRFTYYGRDTAVIKYVASRKLLTQLTWREHGQTSLDFRGASLMELSLDVTRRLKLSVDDELERLRLTGLGKGYAVTVEHPSAGDGLELDLWEAVGGVMPPAVKGLERLSELDLTPMKVVDLRTLARAYPRLRRLTVRGQYARLDHPEALAKLTELESLTLYDFYELDVAALPALEKLPKLNHACFSGLRKSDAQLLRAHFGKLADLEVRGAKNDAWIAANANNPLRNWVDDDEAFGEQAAKAFAKAYRAASAAKTVAAAKTALTDFVKALNRLDGKFGQIDTIRREEAFEAYGQLAALTPADSKVADTWFEELRDF